MCMVWWKCCQYSICCKIILVISLKYLLYYLLIIFLNNSLRIFLDPNLISIIIYILITLPIVFRSRIGNIYNIQSSLLNGLFFGSTITYFTTMFSGLFGLLLFNPITNILGKILIVFISSTSEEMFFRYILFEDIGRKFSIKYSLGITSILFSIYHMPIYDFTLFTNLIIFILPIFILGIMLQKIYIKYNLLTSIVTHFTMNFTSIFISLSASIYTAIMLIIVYLLSLFIVIIK